MSTILLGFKEFLSDDFGEHEVRQVPYENRLLTLFWQEFQNQLPGVSFENRTKNTADLIIFKLTLSDFDLTGDYIFCAGIASMAVKIGAKVACVLMPESGAFAAQSVSYASALCARFGFSLVDIHSHLCKSGSVEFFTFGAGGAFPKSILLRILQNIIAGRGEFGAPKVDSRVKCAVVRACELLDGGTLAHDFACEFVRLRAGEVAYFRGAQGMSLAGLAFYAPRFKDHLPNAAWSAFSYTLTRGEKSVCKAHRASIDGAIFDAIDFGEFDGASLRVNTAPDAINATSASIECYPAVSELKPEFSLLGALLVEPFVLELDAGVVANCTHFLPQFARYRELCESYAERRGIK